VAPRDVGQVRRPHEKPTRTAHYLRWRGSEWSVRLKAAAVRSPRGGRNRQSAGCLLLEHAWGRRRLFPLMVIAARESSRRRMHKTRMETQIDTQTQACLRPGSVLRSAEASLRSIGRGTCPENSRGLAAKSQTRGRQARAAICVLAEPMAAAGQPLACGEPPSSEAAALRLRALVQHVRRSVRQNTTSLSPFSRAPGAAPGPGAALGARPMHQRGPPPNLGCRGSPLAKHLQSDIGSLLRKVGKAGNAPRSSKPGPHTLL
jgi:hypothetical protein